MNDQNDSDSLIITLPPHLLNQSHSLTTFKDPNNADAENLKNEVIIVFTPTEIDKSSDTEVSLKLGYFSNPEKFLSQTETHYTSLKFDIKDEFSSVKNDTLLVICAHTDYLSTYTATLPRQNLPVILPNFFHGPIKS